MDRLKDNIGEAGGKRDRLVILQVLPALETGGVERGTVDIAEAIVYLASDAASFVTGQELTVDGGYQAR